MAKLEVTFKVDADGLLCVHAKELVTGIEQTVSVKPTYGLDDATVEKMLLDALDHGEEDLKRRRLAENRVEAGRIAGATRRALAADAELLLAGERESITLAIEALETAAGGDDPGRIARLIEALDASSKEFATRRMNRAIGRALEGRKVDDVSPGASGDTASHAPAAGAGK
jgi:molecular chaperone HscA